MEYTPAAVAPPKKDAARERVLALLRQNPQPSRGEIARETGVAEATVTRWAKAEGLRLPKGKRSTAPETARHRAIVALADRLPQAEIAKALGITRQAVSQALQKHRKTVTD